MDYWSVRWTPGPEEKKKQCPLHPGVYMGTGKLPEMHDKMIKPFGFSTDFTLLLPNGDAKA